MGTTTSEPRNRGEALRRVRVAVGLSQAALGGAVGRSQQGVARLESGEDRIGPKTAERIVAVLCGRVTGLLMRGMGRT